MVIDTSAIVAILFGEPEARTFAHAIDQDPVRLMSAVSVLEATIVVESELGEAGGRELDLLLHRAGIVVVGFLPEQLDAARRAFRAFGEGRHPAGLNFGDCFSYALAASTGHPLLFKERTSPGPMLRHTYGTSALRHHMLQPRPQAQKNASSSFSVSSGCSSGR